jgi:hypothetical protein
MTDAEKRATLYQEMSAWYSMKARAELGIEIPTDVHEDSLQKEWNAMVNGEGVQQDSPNIVKPILIGALVLVIAGWFFKKF